MSAEDLAALASRVTALEQRVGSEAGLRASGDRDLADMGQTLRAQQYLIQALAITQAQHTTKLEDLRTRFEDLHVKTDQLVVMLTQLIERDNDGKATQ